MSFCRDRSCCRRHLRNQPSPCRNAARRHQRHESKKRNQYQRGTHVCRHANPCRPGTNSQQTGNRTRPQNSGSSDGPRPQQDAAASQCTGASGGGRNSRGTGHSPWHSPGRDGSTGGDPARPPTGPSAGSAMPGKSAASGFPHQAGDNPHRKPRAGPPPPEFHRPLGPRLRSRRRCFRSKRGGGG